MIPAEIIKKGLYFDIETAGITKNLFELRLKNPKLAELWSKRCKWLRLNSGEDFKDASDDLLFLKKASLHPEFSRVVCVSIGAYKEDEVHIISFIGEESEILINTNKVFNNAASKRLRLAGHTIKNFDIPFLGKRMIINKINPSPIINFFDKKPWEMNILDISDIFSFGSIGQSHASLDLMCSVLGVDSPKIDMDGSMVHEEFYSGKIEDIKKYCELDVKAVIDCFNKMNL